jgi:hypothetical protein
MVRCGAVRWNVKVAATHFARQEADEREASPLSEAERTKELLLGMFECRNDAIDGRDWQGSTSRRWTR